MLPQLQAHDHVGLQLFWRLSQPTPLLRVGRLLAGSTCCAMLWRCRDCTSVRKVAQLDSLPHNGTAVWDLDMQTFALHQQ